ncbi:hypothetical protein CVIRNUC_001590 [Coccomyxa viridis]|uniref:Divinyl chlorophyllide a 8-vinyl-reductase, chloroplastic n=1 Tax=Coccomyxa viridis TaxID=1274662 RepID=A0AAV1HVV4_9CHLO|nr:hypothetical protein CVIRNUC_001590 [Coccomyxa viridis]
MLMSHTAQCSMLRGPDGLCRSFPQAFYRPFQRADVHQHTAPVLRPPCQALSSTMRRQMMPSLRQQQKASRLQRCICAAASSDYRQRENSDVRVLVVGATGYIGKFVVKELINRGYNVVPFARGKSGVGGKAGMEDTKQEFEGADVRFGSVSDLTSLRDVAFAEPVDVVVSCLASRTGGKKDSWAVDYQATKNVLEVAREKGAQHFVLLSAICVQKPLLEFQHAKLKLEAALQSAGDITYSIVRPTAFFKSLAGQVQLVKTGKPYVMFGDGQLASCKPISEADLASFMADCVKDPSKANKMLPIGGPGKAWSALEQGEYLFRLAERKPSFIKVPVALMDGIIGFLDLLAKVFPGLEDSAEYGRIGKYYATESMLVYDHDKQQYDAEATPSYGKDTLEEFFRRAVKEDGMKGQELGDAAVF